MSKHTPGPWKLVDRDSVLIPIAPYEWAEAYGGTEANARLIAAAPDLLEALKGMLLHMGMDEDEWNKPTFDHARAAIAKAEEA